MSVPNPLQKQAAKLKFDAADAGTLKRKYEALIARDLSTEQDLTSFLSELDVIEKHYVNVLCEAHFLSAIDVVNEEYSDNFVLINEKVTPVFSKMNNEVNRKLLSVANKLPLDPVLSRNIKSEQAIFSEENISIQVEIERFDKEISEIQGQAVADWEGEKVPLPSLRPVEKGLDRTKRKEAFDAIMTSKMQDRDAINERFEKILARRHRLAKNAGFDSFIDYKFKELKRFDWGTDDCRQFHKAVEKHIVPLHRKLMERRRVNHNLDICRPYDARVDVQAREPDFIYQKDDVESFIAGTGKIIKAVDSELYEYFQRMRDAGLYDLVSRDNKRPGGFMVMYPVYELASVFYNGVGLADDLLVFLHELGHCFHYFLGKNISPRKLQDWTSEVAEGGSMSMEFIGLENATEYISADQRDRLLESRLMQVIQFFPFCAQVDEFQFWLYENPGHSIAERQQVWLALKSKYSSGLDITGYEDALSATDWQFTHILHHPFYFIDYAISDLLALSVWKRYKIDPRDGLHHYKQGCSLAASLPVPEIYKAFGTELDFGESVIGPLAETMAESLKL